MSGGSLEVQETGRALKVHTETPHLVSLGGGRLSTAVTLHPLPEGRTTVGSGQGVDIAVQGTGVEPIHCHIDNQGGVVTLIPQAEMTSVDQIRVSHPTRLSQGCMLCVGRSNTFRFNHPAEARLMKSVLPNPRISMLPIAYYPGDDVGIFGGVEGKPPPAPRRSGGSRDSWGELSSTSSDDLATRMEMAKFISPKVFPPGSCTVNSPASVVLGPRSNTPSKLNLYRNNQTNGSSPLTKTPDSAKFGENIESQFNLSQKETLQNGNRIQNGNIYQNVCALPNGQFVPRLDSPNSRDSSRVNSVSSPSPSERGPSPGSGRPSMSRAISTPSPAFDRNPSYFSVRKSVTSPTASWDSSIEDLTSRKGELEGKRKQAENERVIEQETERLERLRLEEILTMCADYEKQAQWERLNKPQQNRIITNGSLPRDKRLPSPHSPQINQSFTFDTDMPPTIPESFHQDQDISRSPHLENVKPPANYENVTIGHPNSPRTRIKTILSNKESLSRDYSFEFIENKLAILSDYEILGPPPPPRNSSKHIMNSTENQNILNGHYIENELKDEILNGGNAYLNIDYKRTTENKMENYNHKPASIAESNALSKYEFFGFDPRNSLEMNSDSGYQKEKSCSPLRSSSDSLTSNKCKDKNETFTNISPSSKSISRCNTSPSWTNPSIIVESLNVSNSESNKKYTYPTSNGEYTTEQLIMQLDAIVRGSPSRDKLTPSPGPSDRDSRLGAGGRDSGKFILPLPDPATQVELQNSLRLEKIQLMTTLTSLKTKVTEIRQKEEELMREEIEQALVGGELQLQNEKLTQEESRLNLLRDRMTECDKEMDKCVLQQTERQTQSKQRLEQQQGELQAIEERLNSCTEDSEMKLKLMELLRQKQEILEAEKKSFEDMEFSLLEGWLSRRDEVQREVNEICNRCEERREKIKSLEAERDEAERHANANTKQLQVQLIEFLRKIEEGRNRLSEIDLQLQNAEARLSDQEADRKRSQDDLERISRVTSGAPMEMSTNSLGRRTIASLQEIERNRHLHLAKQGSLVIEEERKRVSELKRRVQDEARAEWEERRQRENNCHSLNSVGSEESSLTSSDLHTESASSEDVEKRLTAAPSELKTESPESEDVAKKTHERDELRKKDEREPDSRPLSDASTYSEDQLTVRLRNKSTSNLQRPLTRYLPIRGEALDLRQHIESAGHQVDLCPHVILDKTSCRGFLHKMTSRFHQWNKRWFVFDRTRRTLTYYSDRSERKPRGGAYFQAIEEVYVDHLNCVKSPNPQVTFVIKSSERTYHLVAPSPEAMRIWVDVIFTGAEGYQEFAHGS